MRGQRSARLIDPVQDVESYAQQRAGVRTQRAMQIDIERAKRRGGEERISYEVAIGPFYINDLPGTATTQATLDYFNTSTALSRNSNDQTMGNGGSVIGVLVTADDNRTAGTATVQVRVSGTATDFVAGAVVLNATYTNSLSLFVIPENGVPFVAGDELGVSVTTSGWTPTTANLRVTLIARVYPDR